MGRIDNPYGDRNLFCACPPIETWAEAGEPDSMRLANARVRRMLGEYEAPALDAGIAEALAEFVARRKASEPDAFG